MNEQTELKLNYEEMQKALSLHIWKNDHLREEILRNPKTTIERELGIKFDDDVKITLVSQSQPNEIIFTLPCNIHEAVGQELTDDQLEEVSGGMLYAFWAKTIGTAIGASSSNVAKAVQIGKTVDGVCEIALDFVPYGGVAKTLVNTVKSNAGID